METPVEPASPQPDSMSARLARAMGTPSEIGYSLYSPMAVGLATFLGAPVAGSVIMALNYRRLGKPASARSAVIYGVIATAALIALGFVLPPQMPTSAIAVASIIAMAQVAKTLQGEALDLHKSAGGRIASIWKAAGVGLASLIVLSVVIVVVAYATMPASPKRLAVSSGEILYSGASTEADAKALGQALTDAGYFTPGRAATVLLIKHPSATTVQFVVNPEAAQNDSVINALGPVIERSAAELGAKPITVMLVNPKLQVLRSKKLE
jgi:hypothetical protein